MEKAQAGGTGKCLVVGGAGFLGRVLVRRLADEGWQVRSFDMKEAHREDLRVEVVVGDLADAAAIDEAVQGVDTVFHAAAMICLMGLARPSLRARVHDVNVGGTRRLLEAARRAGVRRFVYTSSNNVCFSGTIVDGDEGLGYVERPVDLYTETKIAAEKLVLEADDKRGMRTCSLRPGGIWGPGPGAILIERFLQELASGTFIATLGSADVVADNTHVENLVDAELLAVSGLAERPDTVGGQPYYITDGEPMNPFEWFRPLCEALGFNFPERRLPAAMIYAIAYLGECTYFLFGVRASLTRIEVLKVTRSHSFSIDKARRDLGYEPRITQQGGGFSACLPFAREYLSQKGARPVRA